MAHGDAEKSEGADGEPAWSLSPRDAASMGTSPAASPRGLCGAAGSHVGRGAASAGTSPASCSMESPARVTPPPHNPLDVPTHGHPASRFFSQFPQLAQPRPLALEQSFDDEEEDTPVLLLAPTRPTAKKEELSSPAASSGSHGLVDAKPAAVKLEDQVAGSAPGQRLLVSTG